MTCGFYSLILLPYFIVLDTYASVAFSTSFVTLSSPDVSTRGFFVSGSARRPSGEFSTSVVALFAFSLGSP
jgi:hypothetical protein